jgi:type III secretion protein Q
LHLKPLALRPVDPVLANATRALGSGVTLAFSVADEVGALTLQLCPAEQAIDAGVGLNTAVGALWLSDASAVLSLVSEQPVVMGGPAQPWYWQFISQQLSPQVARGLAPLSLLAEPFTEPAPTEQRVQCRLTVDRGADHLYAYLSAAPDTLLRWLRMPGWTPLLEPVADSFDLPFPLILARASLTAEQLASLRPGDVLLPQQCLFDPQGSGHVDLAGRRWASHTTDIAGQLCLTLSHEEYSDHE